MQEQNVLVAGKDYGELDEYFKDNRIKRTFLVCGKSINSLRIGRYFDLLHERIGTEVVRFSDFHPNPVYESVFEGVKRFHQSGCDSIVAVGGGSAMDVAKCIKLYSNMDIAVNFLEQKIIPNDVKLLAIPTTAGTGSEATRYAVIYYNGEKQSVMDDSCIPSTVLMDPDVLKSLPIYQKKSTMLDAFCHAVESYWSVNSSEESKKYAEYAIRLILTNMEAYLDNVETGNAAMLRAANLAGRAINITQTTAGHAMCYKLTSLYGLAHGHAAALCVSRLWVYMLEHMEWCRDSRGEAYLRDTFEKLAFSMGSATPHEAAGKLQSILDKFALGIPKPKEEDYEILRKSVNLERLRNNPIQLDEKAIDELYHQILGFEKGKEALM